MSGFTLVPSAGAKVRGSTLSALFSERTPIYAFLSTNQPYTSNNTPADVTDLVAALSANATYDFMFHLFASSAANAAGDVQYRFTFPALAAVDVGSVGPHNSLASGTNADIEAFAATNDSSSPTASFPFGTSTSVTGSHLHVRIVVGATAGNLQLQASQFASNINTTTLLANSYLVGERVL